MDPPENEPHRTVPLIIAVGMVALSACYPAVQAAPAEPIPYIFTTDTPVSKPTVAEILKQAQTRVTPVSTETVAAPAVTATVEAPADPEVEVVGTTVIEAAGDSFFAISHLADYINNDLQAMGADFRMVGDHPAPGNTAASEGHGGFDSGMFLRQLKGVEWIELNGTRTANEKDFHKPDTVVLYLGLNDANNGAVGGFDPVPRYKENMAGIIQTYRDLNSRVKILLVQLVPSLDRNCNTNIPGINAAMIEVAGVMDNDPKYPDSRVYTTENPEELKLLEISDYADNFHLYPSGQEKLAHLITDSLKKFNLVSLHPENTPTPGPQTPFH